MKESIKTVRFYCNGGMLQSRYAGHSKDVKCLAQLELTGTVSEINKQFKEAGWKAGGPGLADQPAMKSHYHRCDWTHYHPMTGRKLES
jgi:hypothetical protein